MPIQIADPEIDRAIQQVASQQPTRTSKTALAEAILRRALEMEPDRLSRWLRQRSDREASTAA